MRYESGFAISHIWAIFELKRDSRRVGEDRIKLKTKILPHFPDCAFGVAMGIAELPADWLDQNAQEEGLKLVRSAPKTR